MYVKVRPILRTKHLLERSGGLSFLFPLNERWWPGSFLCCLSPQFLLIGEELVWEEIMMKPPGLELVDWQAVHLTTTCTCVYSHNSRSRAHVQQDVHCGVLCVVLLLNI